MKDPGFNYQVRKSARRRTLSITVHPDNHVVVSAPARCPRSSILQFVESKSDWVRKAIQANLLKVPPRSRRFENGEKFLYLGKEYTLKVQGGHSPRAALKGETICVRLPAPAPSEVRSILLEWYRERALAKIKEKVPVYAGLIGVKPCMVSIKSLKSRWGSCSAQGRISFAWNIIMAPEEILDYLVVHELCHLVHLNHSQQYWDLVASILPDHRKSRKWLRENGENLSL